LDTVSPLRVFAHLNVERTTLYRDILKVFTDAKERFLAVLRPLDVREALLAAGQVADLPAVEAALGQLVEWGNLAAQPDTSEVATVEEFYRIRLLYQLTPAGEAAEHALAVFHEDLDRPGELKAAALVDIRDYLTRVLELARSDDLPEREVYQVLSALRDRFGDLTGQAQRFMGSLQRAIELHGQSLEGLLDYKERLVDYLERFIGDLVVVGSEIGAQLEAIAMSGIDLILDIGARQELSDRLIVGDSDLDEAEARWRQRWDGLEAWFLRRDGAPAQAELLRARARNAIPSLLAAIAGLHERRVQRSDRAADFRSLAIWFAEASSDGDAHRLWRAAFGLAPCRHLAVDASTLAAWEEARVRPGVSWLDAPPLSVHWRLRETGRTTRRGRYRAVVDYSEGKAALAALLQDENSQIEAARRLLATGRRIRLSELGELPPAAFGLLLDLLGDALAEHVGADETIETASSDGTLSIRLEPPGDGKQAAVRTRDGVLVAPDYHVTISDPFAGLEPEGNGPDRALAS